MASKTATDPLAEYMQNMKLSSCRRVLAKGRIMQASGQWESVGGDDTFACWEQTLATSDRIPESYELDVLYVETKESDQAQPSSSLGTVLLSHGTPGSHNDFKYIVPVLVEKKIRAIVPNYPGHGKTKAPAIFRQSNDERAEFLQNLVNEIGVNKVDVMVGHSAGIYPLLKLAGDDQYYSADGPICKNLIFVNPGGTLMPHRALRPYWLPWKLSRWQYTRFRPFLGWCQYMYGNYVLGLPILSGETAMAATDVVANIGLSQIPKYVERLRSDPKTPRLLMLYAEDDPLIEKERNEETAKALGIDKIFKVSSKEDIEGAIGHVREWATAKEGAKHAGVAFVKNLGAHYLQKHQAAFIASCLEMLVSK